MNMDVDSSSADISEYVTTDALSQLLISRLKLHSVKKHILMHREEGEPLLDAINSYLEDNGSDIRFGLGNKGRSVAKMVTTGALFGDWNKLSLFQQYEEFFHSEARPRNQYAAMFFRCGWVPGGFLAMVPASKYSPPCFIGRAGDTMVCLLPGRVLLDNLMKERRPDGDYD